MAWIGAAIGAVAAAGSAWWAHRQEKKNRARNLEVNKELAKFQYSQDVDMWNKGNIYNAPEAQMERLKAAGLNPNLVYGGNAPGNAPGQLPKYNAPTADFSGIPASIDTAGMLQMFQDFTVKQAQVDNLREQNKVIRENQVISHERGVNAAGYYRAQRQQLERRKEGEIYRSELDQYKAMDFWSEMHQRQELRPYQLEFQKGQTRNIGLQHDVMRQAMDKTTTQIEFQNLQNEWYLTKLFGPALTLAAKGLGAFLGPGTKPGVAKTVFEKTLKPILNVRRFKGGQRYRKFTPE